MQVRPQSGGELICKECKNRKHDHCLNLGKWSTESRESSGLIGGVAVFNRRIEPTKTWCDCAHEILAAEEYLDQTKVGSGKSVDRAQVANDVHR